MRTAHERHASGTRVQQQLGEPRAESSTVSTGLQAEGSDVVPMPMPDDGRGLHHERAAIQDHAGEHVDVLPSSGASAHPERSVESTEVEGGATT